MEEVSIANKTPLIKIACEMGMAQLWTIIYQIELKFRAQIPNMFLSRISIRICESHGGSNLNRRERMFAWGTFHVGI